MNELFTYFGACSAECRPGPPKCHFIMRLQSTVQHSLPLWPATERKLDISSCIPQQNMPDGQFLSLKCHILMQLLTDNKLTCTSCTTSFNFFCIFRAKHVLLWCFRTARPRDHLSVKPETWKGKSYRCVQNSKLQSFLEHGIGWVIVVLIQLAMEASQVYIYLYKDMICVQNCEVKL